MKMKPAGLKKRKEWEWDDDKGDVGMKVDGGKSRII